VAWRKTSAGARTSFAKGIDQVAVGRDFSASAKGLGMSGYERSWKRENTLGGVEATERREARNNIVLLLSKEGVEKRDGRISFSVTGVEGGGAEVREWWNTDVRV